MATFPLTLESSALVEANARGEIAGEQRRALARDFYGEHWKTPAWAVMWIGISLVMLRILLPAVLPLVASLFAERDEGAVPVRVGGNEVSLPLWTMLKVGLILFALTYVVVIVVQAGHLARFLRQRHALLHERAVSAVGEVQERGGETFALVGGRLLRPWDARAMTGVAPGRYRFYLLPRHDWLLSAERMRDWERPTADEEAVAAQYTVGTASGFAPVALADNGTGRLTPEQARSLRDTAPDTGPRTLALFGFAFAIGVAGAVTYTREVAQLGWTTDRLERLGACVAWSAIWVVITAKQFRDRARQRRDASAGRVAVYEGPVTKWEGWRYHDPHGSNEWMYRYECPVGRFEVSEEAYRALVDGGIYRVYYAPESKQLVNIEPVAAGAAPS